MRALLLLGLVSGLCIACSTSERDTYGRTNAGNTTSTTPVPPAQTPSTTPPRGAPEKASTTAPAPVTGKTVIVNMVGDAKGYRFEPSSITLARGDGVKFVNVTGGPHNVTFFADSIPSGAAKTLQTNMPNTTAPLMGPLMVTPNETYTVAFTGAIPGVYHFYCTPHQALGMKGVITVK